VKPAVRVDIVTIFPRMIDCALQEGVVRRAVTRGLVDVRVHDLRAFTTDRHRSVDDAPYGGGPGMVFKPEPLFKAIEAIAPDRSNAAVVLMSPQGRSFSQAEAVRLSGRSQIVLVCGRYEGVDDRVRTSLADEELSIGDYVLTGGELPAMVVLDAVVRLVPGVVGDEESVESESFARGLLEHPQFTRPAQYRELKVPDVLLSGDHAEIRRWRKREALRRTLENRPDLLTRAELDLEEREMLRDLTEHEKGAEHGGD
jgi:tRNA (guanine37-N1)-methyltransferase